jgi:low affinity Fe/Cu permease
VTRHRSPVGRTLERLSAVITRWTGGSGAFALALGTVVIWAISGPMFGFSDTWQLVINTGTTVVTFLMVFLIQRAQNKDALAIQLKLNELVAAVRGASNTLIDIEDLDEEELQTLHRYYARLAELERSTTGVKTSHSLAHAQTRHQRKQRSRKRKETKSWPEPSGKARSRSGS